MMSYLSQLVISALVLGSGFAAVFSVAAHADDGDEPLMVPAYYAQQEVSFDYAGRYQSYHCDFVRAETTAILRKLGATEIEVFCDGGLPNNRGSHIDAFFVALRQTTEDKSTRQAELAPVEFNFVSSCDLRDTLITSLLESFDVSGLTKGGTCRNSRGSLDFQFSTLF